MIYHTEKFGKFTLDTLTCPDSGAMVSVIRDCSAAIHTLKLSTEKGTKAIISESPLPGEYEESLKKYPSCKLSPYPSRLRNGSFSFQGKRYELPKNDSSGKHSIHGLLSFEPFALKEERADNQLIYTYSFKGTEGFPFTFNMEIVYTLTASELNIETRYTNTHGSEFPLGDGWHHYFSTPEGLENYKLTLPVDRTMVLDNELLPSGEKKTFSLIDTPLKNVELDACFLIQEQEGLAETVLENKDFSITIWQQTGMNKYNYLVVYTHDSRKKIAIEPLTCGVDMLNTGESMILLPTDGVLSLKMGIGLASCQ